MNEERKYGEEQEYTLLNPEFSDSSNTYDISEQLSQKERLAIEELRNEIDLILSNFKFSYREQLITLFEDTLENCRWDLFIDKLKKFRSSSRRLPEVGSLAINPLNSSLVDPIDNIISAVESYLSQKALLNLEYKERQKYNYWKPKEISDIYGNTNSDVSRILLILENNSKDLKNLNDNTHHLENKFQALEDTITKRVGGKLTTNLQKIGELDSNVHHLDERLPAHLPGRQEFWGGIIIAIGAVGISLVILNSKIDLVSESYQKVNESYQKLNEIQINSLKEFTNSLKKFTNSLQEFNKTEIDNLKKFNKTEIDNLKKFNKTEIDNLKKINKTEIDNLKKFNEAQIKILKDSLNRIETEQKNIKDTLSKMNSLPTNTNSQK